MNYKEIVNRWITDALATRLASARIARKWLVNEMQSHRKRRRWSGPPSCFPLACFALHQVLLQPSQDQNEMRSILSETLLTARAELDSLCHPCSQRVEPEARGEGAEGEKTLALLEQYAELLLKSVERKLDTKS